MLLRAQADYDLDLKRSVLIGDKVSDIAAAEAAGVGTRIWLKPRTGTPDAAPVQCHAADSLEDIRARFFSRRLSTLKVAEYSDVAVKPVGGARFETVPSRKRRYPTLSLEDVMLTLEHMHSPASACIERGAGRKQRKAVIVGPPINAVRSDKACSRPAGF